MNRKKLIKEIWKLSKEEYETPVEVLDLAMDTTEELKERLQGIKEWLKLNI